MTIDYPINLKLNSFAHFEDALDMCDFLERETGEKYTVMSDSRLGFTAKKIGFSNRKNDSSLKNNEFRQAWRGFVTNYLQMLVGIFLMINPYKILGWLFSWLSIEEIPTWFNLKGFGEVVGTAGLLLMIYGLRFIYSFFAEKLYIDEDGVILKKGIIAQSQVQIRFGDIKTIGVQQSVLDRLFGIGTIHLDSAGTNGTVDIEFKNIIDPVSMRRTIQHMIDDYIRYHG